MSNTEVMPVTTGVQREVPQRSNYTTLAFVGKRKSDRPTEDMKDVVLCGDHIGDRDSAKLLPAGQYVCYQCGQLIVKE